MNWELTVGHGEVQLRSAAALFHRARIGAVAAEVRRRTSFPAILIALLLLAIPGCGRQPQEAEVRRPDPGARRVDVQQTPHEFPPSEESLDLPSSETSSAPPETGRGFVYRNDRISKGPWSVNLLKVERGHADLELTTTIGRGERLGLSVLSEQVASLPPEVGRPLAAVNGDFYRTEHERFPGDPRGLQICRGELISAPGGKTAFWLDTQGQPQMANVVSHLTVTWPDGETTPFGLNEERGSNEAVLYTSRAGPSTRTSGGRELVLVRDGDSSWLPLRAGAEFSAQVRDVRQAGNSRLSSETMVLSIGPTLLARVPRVQPGAVLLISTRTSPDLTGAQLGLGGGPLLLHQGKVQSTRSNRADERHPRTAFGWNSDYYFLVQVDGRQRGFSVGMTLPELAAYLAKQGCEEAMNLDGGGSSEMWVEGEVVNSPCYGHERSTANALVVAERNQAAARAGAGREITLR